MSIDTIQLPGHLCQIMYTNSLIEASKTIEKKAHKLQPEIIKNDIISSVPVKEIQAKTIINSLGENKGNILFLVNNDQNKFLADDEMKLLSDLLTACKITMADIALVNYHQHPELNYQELSHQFQPKKVLIFGITTSELQLPFTIPFFQIQKFQEKIYMVSPSLSDFLNNKELKMSLWNSLKKIFLLTN